MRMMEKERAPFHACVFFIVLLTTGIGVNVNGHPNLRRHHHHRHRLQNKSSDQHRLFVFGDSYADTGNLAKDLSPSWSDPYGITFPRKPTGRFSDGRVFTDYVASFLGIRSPIPYKYRKYGKKLLPYGMNFAVGGSGVFDGLFFQDNLTVQIDHFKAQVDEGVFPDLDLGRSTAVVCISGNDYMFYEATGGNMEGLKDFIPTLIKQLKSDLKRIHQLGVGKIAATTLHPIGCAPRMSSAYSYRNCNQTVNLAVMYHNGLLAEAVSELNMETTGTPFTIIDLFGAFTTVLNREMKKSSDALRPCCQGVSSDYSCGSTGENGVAEYNVCETPQLRFYWDSVHPTQAGWQAAFSSLGASLNSLLN